MSELHDFSRLCIHTMTHKPWTLADCIAAYRKAGVPGITVWRHHLAPQGPAESGKMLADSGLTVVSLCRGGFFPSLTQEGRQAAIDDNLRAIDEAAAIGAPLVVLVPGAVPGQPLEASRDQITEGISAVAPHAQAAGVKLGIEALHPMYADDRSAVNTLRQANDMAEHLDDPSVGVTVDVYHLWWDPELESQIARAGNRILSFHVCDWRTPTRDILNDRGLMGEGCVDVRRIRGWVERAGFKGWIEVEVFSTEHWAEDQVAYLERIKQAYLQYV